MDRTSAAEGVADTIRQRLAQGLLLPGNRLSEDHLVDDLGVSRNTLREAFRLLTHERLLVHQLHRGVFVPSISIDELADLFLLRLTVQSAALRHTGASPNPEILDQLRVAVDEGRAGAESADWARVGTANMHFHEHLVSLAGSRRLNQLIRRILAELRIAFHVMQDGHRFYGAYVPRNAALLERVEQGDTAGAIEQLEVYLRDSEDDLVTVHRERPRVDDQPTPARHPRPGGRTDP